MFSSPREGAASCGAASAAVAAATTRTAPGAPPAQGGPRCVLCAPHLVCRHRKVWMGKGMPRPLSCSWPSELFLFTMMVAPGSPTAGPSAGSSLAAAASSSSSCSPHLPPPPPPPPRVSAAPLRPDPASLSPSPAPPRAWNMAAGGGEGWRSRGARRGALGGAVRLAAPAPAPCFQHLPLWTAARAGQTGGRQELGPG